VTARLGSLRSTCGKRRRVRAVLRPLGVGARR
jgi:hypothetical protein